MPKVKCQTMDGEIIEIDDDVAKVSKLIEHKLYILRLLDVPADAETIISVPGVTMSKFQKLLEWMTHHRGETQKQSSKKTVKDVEIDSFDAAFLNVDEDSMEKLTNAAKSLQLKKLLAQISKTKLNKDGEDSNSAKNVGPFTSRKKLNEEKEN